MPLFWLDKSLFIPDIYNITLYDLKELTYVTDNQKLYKNGCIPTMLYLETHVWFNNTIVFNILYDYVSY